MDTVLNDSILAVGQSHSSNKTSGTMAMFSFVSFLPPCQGSGSKHHGIFQLTTTTTKSHLSPTAQFPDQNPDSFLYVIILIINYHSSPGLTQPEDFLLFLRSP